MNVMRIVAAGWLMASLTSTVVVAESVEDFYRGKTITLMVGSVPGGGYDGDSRVVARHLGQHIPGSPTIIVQNVPGARGLNSANNLYNIAKKDGTAMGVLERVHLVDAYLMPDGVRYDERQFNWIGSTGSEIGMAFAWHTSPQKTVEDIRQAEFIVGGNSNSATLPKIYNSTMGTKFKIVTGYPGSEEVLLAVEKGEVQGIGNYSLSNMLSKHADWISDHKITILFQNGLSRIAALPNVPSALELALDENKRGVLDLWLAPNMVARPFAMPPGVPADRLAAVRQGFMALFDDPAFVADAQKIGMEIDPKDGDYIDKLVTRLRALPASVIDAAKAAGE